MECHLMKIRQGVTDTDKSTKFILEKFCSWAVILLSKKKRRAKGELMRPLQSLNYDVIN